MGVEGFRAEGGVATPGQVWMMFSRLVAAGRKLCLCLFVLLWEDLGSGWALVIAIAPTQEFSIVLASSLYICSAISINPKP